MSTVTEDQPRRIAVAMSGGVDSSVAAALLVDHGHDAVGLTARMWKEGSRCCSLEDVERARAVCDFLGIRHVVINALDVFSRCVAERFAAEYVRGRTPSPCVVCNQVVKFGVLLTRAIQFGCEAMATGHYARLETRADGVHLLKARDRTRDQTYFLHRLSQRQLSHAMFPIGDMIKATDIVPYTEQRGLPLAPRPESRDICFAPPGRHHEVVEQFFPAVARPGPLVDDTGRRIGTHEGIHRYTVGQRRGLGVSGEREPVFVKAVRPDTNTVVVSGRSDMLSQRCVVEDLRWVAGQAPPAGRPYDVRIRYRHEGAAARFAVRPDGRLDIVFDEPQFAVAPGQAAVLYDGDEVLGGGWISRV